MARKKSGSRVSASKSSAGEVLERLLDKGIVVDAAVRVSVVGLALVDIDAVVVVATIDTYAEKIHRVYRPEPARVPRPPVSAPPPVPPRIARHLPAAPGAQPPVLPIEGEIRRPAAARRPRRARSSTAHATFRCAIGCTFSRRVDPSTTFDAVPCPYRREVACLLKRVS